MVISSVPKGNHQYVWFFNRNFAGMQHLICINLQPLQYDLNFKKLMEFCQIFWNSLGVVNSRNPANFFLRAENFETYLKQYLPWEPTTFIFRGYNPYIGVENLHFSWFWGPRVNVISAISSTQNSLLLCEKKTRIQVVQLISTHQFRSPKAQTRIFWHVFSLFRGIKKIGEF